MTQENTFDTNLEKLHAVERDICAGKLREATAALDALNAITPSDARTHLAAAMLAHATRNPPQEIASLRRYRTRAEVVTSSRGIGKNLVAPGPALQEMKTLEITVAVANAAGDAGSADRSK